MEDVLRDLRTRLTTLQEQEGLTDRALAAAIQATIRQGAPPESLENPARALVTDLTALFFLRAPRLDPTYLVVSSMHLDLVIGEDRSLEDFFDELSTLEDTPAQPEATWLQEALAIADSLPSDSTPSSTQQALTDLRTHLEDHHDHLLAFTRDVLQDLTHRFDADVQSGTLQPEALADTDPATALQDARAARDSGDPAGAEPLFDHYLQTHPNDVEILVERGILRAALEDLSGALEDFDRALQLDHSHLVARLNRALTLHSLGRIDAALDDYDKALATVDDDPEIWTNRAIARFSKNDFPGALRDFNRAIDLDDTLLAAFFQRGNLHRVMGDLGAALNDYQRVIRIKPDFPDVYAARGYLYLHLEDPEKAAADFGMAMGLRPGDPDHYYNRAHARLLTQDFQGAIDDYDKALELAPDDVETLANRGAARMLIGDLDGAVQDWETAIAIDPYYPTPYLKRASMWIATEQPEEAARDLRIALDNAPDDWPHRKAVEDTLDELLQDLGFDSPD